MGVRTLLLYLIGDRQAIVTLAAHRSTVWLGCIFVLSAAFARESDGADLLHEPWHLLVPFAASLAACSLLYLFLCRLGSTPSWRGFKSFLGLFWMTAPMAWLYAIPYERFSTPLSAIKANLATLALVAAWRVILMMRVLVVAVAIPPAKAIFSMLLFADILAMVILFKAGPSLLPTMGGMNEREELLASSTTLVQVLGFWTLPLWAVGLFVLSILPSPFRPAVSARPARGGPSWPLLALAAFSLLVWIPVLAVTQPERYHRGAVERAVKEGRLADALEYMSALKREDFPRGWNPPLHSVHGDDAVQVVAMLEIIADRQLTSWVREHYLSRLTLVLKDRPSQETGPRIRKLLKKLPEGPALIRASFSGEDAEAKQRLKEWRPYLPKALQLPDPP